MAYSHVLSLLLLCLVSPLSILAQRHGGYHQPPGAPPASTPPAASPAPPASTPPAASPAPATATDAGDSSNTAAASSSAPASTAGTTEDSSTDTSSASCSGSGMTIKWTGESVSYSWSGGSGQTTGCLNLGSSFQGQVAVGGSGGTIFEGNPSGYFDVSYILGYSVPMLCSSGSAKTGCSIDLLGNGGKAGTIHKNPTGPGGAHDPGAYNGCASCTPWCYACSAPDAFFAPCAGSAYTFPYDDTATVGPASGTITCCIGTSCGTTGREGSTKGGHPEPTRNPPCTLCSGSSKRSVDQLEEVFKRYEEEAPAQSAALLPRRRKMHKRHAVAHEVKVSL